VSKLSKYRLLFLGVLSPLAAIFLYALVYTTLSRLSANLEKDWLFRLALSTAAMVVPFLVILALAIRDRRRYALLLPGKIGMALAILSLGLVWKPVTDGMIRWKQSHNQAMQDVDAPPFDTVDLDGKTQRLVDQKGKVVLVNIWATWCGPCRAEMPQLDRLYQERKGQGFIAFGLSDEDVGVQRRFLQQVPVTYPLLTQNGQVAAFYRDIARYPAVFLIDRQGRLQLAPGPDQPFEKLESTVDALLKRGP
jgi:cytochrome c biogenesis protein CcmG, thiol:disulfide interchange protein DsbE